MSASDHPESTVANAGTEARHAPDAKEAAFALVEQHDTRTADQAAAAPVGDDALNDLLSEIRILLPGAELLAAFLIPLPFTQRFERLSFVERYVYLFTFVTTVLSLACLVTPAVYHRMTRPIHDKRAFKNFANRFVVAGLAIFAVSLVLCTYLVTAVVVNTAAAIAVASGIAVVLVILWWVIPRARLHDGEKRR